MRPTVWHGQQWSNLEPIKHRPIIIVVQGVRPWIDWCNERACGVKSFCWMAHGMSVVRRMSESVATTHLEPWMDVNMFHGKGGGVVCWTSLGKEEVQRLGTLHTYIHTDAYIHTYTLIRTPWVGETRPSLLRTQDFESGLFLLFWLEFEWNALNN